MDDGFSRARAAKELLARRAARDSLLDYTKRVLPDYQVQQHHERLAEALEALERGDINRLIVSMPPRHGKTELASKRFPAWYLGRNPHKQIMALSYGSKLSEKASDKVRQQLRSPEFASVFPETELRPDRRSVEEWETIQGGGLKAAGIDTGVTGHGGDLIVADDLIKGRREANSQTTRDHAWEVWSNDVMSRRQWGDRAAIVLIGTRWHWDDVIGRELDLRPDKWTVINFPAEAKENDILGRKPGEALWPEAGYTLAYLADQKMGMTPGEYAALYQQEPTPDQGAFFLKEYIRWRPRNLVPKADTLRVFITSDWATTEDANDYTVHAVWGLDPDDDLFLLDGWRSQADPDVGADALLDLIRKHRVRKLCFDNVTVEKAIMPFVNRRLKERKLYVEARAYPAGANKEVKAMSIRGRMAQGKVYIADDLPHREDWERELLTFPGGINDDVPDVFGLAGRALDDEPHRDASRPKPQPPRAYNPLNYAREPDDAPYNPLG